MRSLVYITKDVSWKKQVLLKINAIGLSELKLIRMFIFAYKYACVRVCLFVCGTGMWKIYSDWIIFRLQVIHISSPFNWHWRICFFFIHQRNDTESHLYILGYHMIHISQICRIYWVRTTSATKSWLKCTYGTSNHFRPRTYEMLSTSMTCVLQVHPM